jgi:hypothetical protein
MRSSLALFALVTGVIASALEPDALEKRWQTTTVTKIVGTTTECPETTTTQQQVQ